MQRPALRTQHMKPFLLAIIGGEKISMILLLDQKEGENNLKNIMQRKFRRYNIKVYKTGIDNQILDLLISIYLEPEFNHIEKGNYENRGTPGNSSSLLHPE